MQSYDGMSAVSPPTRHDDADVFGETSYRNMIFTWHKSSDMFSSSATPLDSNCKCQLAPLGSL